MRREKRPRPPSGSRPSCRRWSPTALLEAIKKELAKPPLERPTTTLQISLVTVEDLAHHLRAKPGLVMTAIQMLQRERTLGPKRKGFACEGLYHRSSWFIVADNPPDMRP